MLTQERLKEILHYDPETGIFTYLKSTAGVIKVGQLAGSFDKTTSYSRLTIDGNKYYLHYLAWLYVYRYFPKKLDHKDTDRTNNSINNLRVCSHSQNMWNSKSRNGKVGIKGIIYEEKTNRYKAQLMTFNKPVSKSFNIFKFGSKEKALAAATKWIQEQRTILHGEFANHGI